jgi:uncharacterized protein (TIGR02145 family)
MKAILKPSIIVLFLALFSAIMEEKVIDIDGNEYKVIKIGEQIWMAENLKTTRYRDGTAIPLVTDSAVWSNLKTPGYCCYNNDIGLETNYGVLYNWYAVSNSNLCPSGWHVPTDAEWTTLTDFLGGEPVAGGKLKETGTFHWKFPNTGATNETGFTALPAGGREHDGTFANIGEKCAWWSATEDSFPYARFRFIGFDLSEVHRISWYVEAGFSIRCLKD